MSVLLKQMILRSFRLTSHSFSGASLVRKISAGFIVLVLLLSAQLFADENSTATTAVEPVENSVESAVHEAADRSSVLKSFVGSNRGEMIASYEEQKARHEIMFYMGAALLLFVFLTAGYGIAMGMLGKEVFVQHMICAGITVFLAVAHSVVAVVWFFPF